MKYAKGNIVFPEKLLEEIQKYIQGGLVYIPQVKGARKQWGVRSGQREQLISRNQKICAEFQLGVSIEQLTLKYHLSHDTIKKIVYTKKS